MKLCSLLLGCLAFLVTVSAGELRSQSMVELKHAADSSQAGFTRMPPLHGSYSYFVAPGSLFNLKDVDSASTWTGKSTDGQPDQALMIHFKTALADSMRHLTTANLHKRLAIVVDGKLLGAPLILAPLRSANLMVPVPTVAEANELASKINHALKELNK